jgi:hypothetical protein
MKFHRYYTEKSDQKYCRYSEKLKKSFHTHSGEPRYSGVPNIAGESNKVLSSRLTYALALM